MVQIGHFFIDLKTIHIFKSIAGFEVNTIFGSRGIFFGEVRPYKEKNLGGLTCNVVKAVIFTLD